jgi:hypothetical protein
MQKVQGFAAFLQHALIDVYIAGSDFRDKSLFLCVPQNLREVFSQKGLPPFEADYDNTRAGKIVQNAQKILCGQYALRGTPPYIAEFTLLPAEVVDLEGSIEGVHILSPAGVRGCVPERVEQFYSSKGIHNTLAPKAGLTHRKSYRAKRSRHESIIKKFALSVRSVMHRCEWHLYPPAITNSK